MYTSFIWVPYHSMNTSIRASIIDNIYFVSLIHLLSQYLLTIFHAIMGSLTNFLLSSSYSLEREK